MKLIGVDARPLMSFVYYEQVQAKPLQVAQPRASSWRSFVTEQGMTVDTRSGAHFQVDLHPSSQKSIFGEIPPFVRFSNKIPSLSPISIKLVVPSFNFS